MRTAVIRADGSLEIGHGHIFRTLVLAEELRLRGWSVIYASRDLPDAPLSRISSAGHVLELIDGSLDEAEDAVETGRIVLEHRAGWLVIDRYATEPASLQCIRESGARILAIDDVCEHPFPVDIVVNQNTNALDLPYQTRADTVRLLGPGYALVRRAYRNARPAAFRRIDAVRRVMVFMGSGDPCDATGKVVEALARVAPKLEIDVITGAAYPHRESLLRLANASPHTVNVLRDLKDLSDPMSRADAAIAAGGSATWELCCMGVPMLLMPIAGNQEGIARSMHARGCAHSLGKAEEAVVADIGDSLGRILKDTAKIAMMGMKAWMLVDGLGAARIADAMMGVR